MSFRYLEGRPEIDRKRIGFWGSSEGGMLATQVAARSQDVAFANSSGFMGMLWEWKLPRLRIDPATALRST